MDQITKAADTRPASQAAGPVSTGSGEKQLTTINLSQGTLANRARN